LVRGAGLSPYIHRAQHVRPGCPSLADAERLRVSSCAPGALLAVEDGANHPLLVLLRPPSSSRSVSLCTSLLSASYIQSSTSLNALCSFLVLHHLCSTHAAHSRNEGANSYSNTLFEYCPMQGSDPNHYWPVGDGTVRRVARTATLFSDLGYLSTLPDTVLSPSIDPSRRAVVITDFIYILRDVTSPSISLEPRQLSAGRRR
jgi:hypothetical protein